MKRFLFVLITLMATSVSVFSQGQFLRGYKLYEHNPTEGVYERFFGYNGNEKKPIKELCITQRSDGNVSIWADFGVNSGFGKPAEEESDTATTDGGISTTYSYYFPGTPISMIVIEVLKPGKKIPECMIAMKSMGEIIYFAKATKVINKEELKLFSKKK